MAREKVIVRRAADVWVCLRPAYGFGTGVIDARLFRTWREAMNYATATTGSGACADLQVSGQLHDAVGSVPMWTPISRCLG